MSLAQNDQRFSGSSCQRCLVPTIDQKSGVILGKWENNLVSFHRYLRITHWNPNKATRFSHVVQCLRELLSQLNLVELRVGPRLPNVGPSCFEQEEDRRLYIRESTNMVWSNGENKSIPTLWNEGDHRLERRVDVTLVSDPTNIGLVCWHIIPECARAVVFHTTYGKSVARCEKGLPLARRKGTRTVRTRHDAHALLVSWRL